MGLRDYEEGLGGLDGLEELAPVLLANGDSQLFNFIIKFLLIRLLGCNNSSYSCHITSASIHRVVTKEGCPKSPIFYAILECLMNYQIILPTSIDIPVTIIYNKIFLSFLTSLK